MAQERGATGGPTFPAAHAATTKLALPSGRTRIPAAEGAARGEAGVRSWTWSPRLRPGKTSCPLLPWDPLQRLGHHQPVWGAGPRRPPGGGGPRSSQQAHPLWCPAVEPWGVLTVNGQAMPGWSCCPRSLITSPKKPYLSRKASRRRLHRACFASLPRDRRKERQAPTFQFHSAVQAPPQAAAAGISNGTCRCIRMAPSTRALLVGGASSVFLRGSCDRDI